MSAAAQQVSTAGVAIVGQTIADRDVNIHVSLAGNAPPSLVWPLSFEGPGKVPALPVPHFTGRHDEMNRLVKQLTAPEERTVCVVAAGLGGIGKTAVARHFVATEARQVFPDGCIWLDATQLKSELVRAARRLGYTQEPEPTPDVARSFVADVLSLRRVLLVVDNVPEKLEDSVEQLLPLVGGQCRTLITSRCRTLHQRLSAPTSSLELGCWSRDAAIAYMRRLGGRCESCSEAELGDLAEFVGLLPLGVRLIALLLGRRITKSPSELLDEVRRKPLQSLDSVVTGIDRGVAQTFLTAFEALTETEKRVLWTLSACARATSDTIVAEVSKLPLAEAQLALEHLNDWSLADYTDRSDSPWGLHDVVRLFAREQVGFEDVRTAHQDWAIEHCKRFGTPSTHLEFARGADEVATVVLQQIQANELSHVNELYGPLHTHLMKGGRLTEAVDITERLLCVSTEASELRYECYGHLGLCFQELGDVAKAIEQHERALVMAQQRDAPGGQAEQLGYLGICQARLGRLQKAIEYFEQSLKIHRQLGQRLGEAARLGNERASAFLSECLTAQALQLGNLGNCYHEHDISRAIELHQESLALHRQTDHRGGQAEQLAALGICYGMLGDLRKAVSHFEQSLALDRQLGNQVSEARQLGNLGPCYRMLGDVSRAIGVHQQALALFRQFSIPKGQANQLGNLGNCYAERGEWKLAVESHTEAFALTTKIGDLLGQATHLGNLASCYLRLGKTAKAISSLERALALSRQLGSIEGESHALCNLGLCYRSIGDIAGALAHFEHSLGLASQLGSLEGQAVSLSNLADCCQALGDTEKAREYFARSAELYRLMGLPNSHSRDEREV